MGPWQGGWERGVGPYSPALPSAPVFVRSTDTSLQEAGRRVIGAEAVYFPFLALGRTHYL